MKDKEKEVKQKMTDKKENLTLEEIKKDIKEILELLKNPKKEINNERQYNQNSSQKKDIVLKNPNAPATIGQKNFLTSKEYQGDVDELTQMEASQLIQAYIKRGNEEHDRY